MIVVTVTETKEGTGINSGPDGLNTAVGTTRVFDADVTMLATDAISDILYAILSASGVPARGDVHPANSWAFCDSVDISHVDGNSYKVTANYRDLGNPATRLAEVQYTSNVTTETIDVCLVEDTVNGGLKFAAIENSAGEPLTCEEDFHDGVFTASGYSATWSASAAKAYRNTVNSANWFGNAAGTLLLVKYDAEPVMFGTTKYWKWNIEIHSRADGWLRRMLDQGTRTRDGAGLIANILDDDGNPITSPAKLDGSGGLLPTASDPVYLYKQTKLTYSFAGLPITSADVS